MANTRVQHWVRDLKTRAAWCGLLVSNKALSSPWPITCKKCCVAIRKGRLRQIELENSNASRRGRKFAAELGALQAANWPMYPALTPQLGITQWPRTIVTGPGKPLPKNLTFTTKEVEQIVEFLVGVPPEKLRRLWITEAEEQQIIKILEPYHVSRPPQRTVEEAWAEALSGRSN